MRCSGLPACRVPRTAPRTPPRPPPTPPVRGSAGTGARASPPPPRPSAITEEELRAALEDGQSIAQVAEAEGVDVQVVIDALVADATERLEEAITDLPDRMTDVVNREGLPDRGGPGGPGGRHLFRPGLDAAADAIGITEDDLRAALQDGDTIADVATANDVEVQTVIDALVADATAHIDEEVAEGDLTEEEAAERKADLEERITALVNGERPERPADAPVADDA